MLPGTPSMLLIYLFLYYYFFNTRMFYSFSYIAKLNSQLRMNGFEHFPFEVGMGMDGREASKICMSQP